MGDSDGEATVDKKKVHRERKSGWFGFFSRKLLSYDF